MKKIKIRKASTKNSVGGTTLLDFPSSLELNVKVIREWDDYETGTHYELELQDEAVIKQVEKLSTSEYNAIYYLTTYGKDSDLYKSTLEAEKNYNPARIFVSEFDIVKWVK